MEPTLILGGAIWQLSGVAWHGQRASRAASLSPCLIQTLLELTPPVQPTPAKQMVLGAPSALCSPVDPCN